MKIGQVLPLAGSLASARLVVTKCLCSRQFLQFATQMEEKNFCKTFRPSREEFSKPFCEYVQKICRENPDIAMFKVVPPKSWKPRRKSLPALEDIRIETPIKQHVSTLSHQKHRNMDGFYLI